MAKEAGWYPDPGEQFGRRWWDGGAWSPWVSPSGQTMFTEPTSRRWPPPGRPRRGRVVAMVLLAAVLAVLLVGCLALADRVIRSEELAGTSEVVAEMNTWELPPSVERSNRADDIERGTFGASTPTVTRWFDPVGMAPADALLDLVRSLETQGYEFTQGPTNYWSSACRYNSKYCDVDISLDPTGRRIAVYVSP